MGVEAKEGDKVVRPILFLMARAEGQHRKYYNIFQILEKKVDFLPHIKYNSFTAGENR